MLVFSPAEEEGWPHCTARRRPPERHGLCARVEVRARRAFRRRPLRPERHSADILHGCRQSIKLSLPTVQNRSVGRRAFRYIRRLKF